MLSLASVLTSLLDIRPTSSLQLKLLSIEAIEERFKNIDSHIYVIFCEKNKAILLLISSCLRRSKERNNKE